jgi:Subtilase family
MHLTPGMPRRGRVRGRIAAVAVSTVALGGLLAAGPALASPAPHGAPTPYGAPARGAALRAACPAVPVGRMRCFVLYRPQYAVNAALAAGISGHKTRPRGWGAKTLEHAYRLPVNRRSHQTVAVSIAFHTPKLAKYLKIYREHYGLPPCGMASGCLRIVNQNGKTTPRAPSGLFTGWDVEATLDVSMISAACPRCKILVVEANDNEVGNLAKTDDTAARLGAEVISNSYGLRENGLAMTFRKHYRHPGHMVVVSSGDTGFDAANFPANLGSVTAVGGTELARAHNRRGFTERVWNDPNLFGAASSGCSAYVGKPAWQHDQHCPGRTVADISAIAARVPIFNAAWGGWLTVAGTSVAAPFVSGTYGLAGNAASMTPRFLYKHASDFFDVTRGNNSLVSGPPKSACDDYLCEAKEGYDAPTGLGTPDGIAGF